MEYVSATNTLTDYINNTESQEISTSPSSTSISTDCTSESLQNEINQQLNDLKIQFQNSIKNLQYSKKNAMSLKPSFSMPQLPLSNKKRKKPRPLIPLYDTEIIPENSNIHMLTSPPSSVQTATVYSSNLSENILKPRNNNLMPYYADTHNRQINQKLDSLISVINSQQRLLENLIKEKHQKKKHKKAKKIKTKSKSTQTDHMPWPHIISGRTSKQDSHCPSLPPIPKNENVNNNMSIPYDVLLKLVSAAANCNQMNQSGPMQNQHFMYNRNNDRKQLMSPKSTLYFSD